MCRRYTTYKTAVVLQLVKLGYMFRPLPGHYQANKETVLINCFICCVTTAHCNKLVKEIGWENVDSIHVIHDMDQWGGGSSELGNEPSDSILFGKYDLINY